MCSVPVVDMSEYEKQSSLHEMFIRQARLTPDKPAVVTYDGQQISFQQLDEMSDLLSIKLQGLGVKHAAVVGILMEKCLEYTISYIAILKAGGAYLPLDLSYPIALLGRVMEDSKPVAVCTKSAHKNRLEEVQASMVLLDGDWITEIKTEVKRINSIPGWVKVSLDDIAYTVYSSGTTGQPKGIQCPHRGAVFSYHWRHLAYPYKEEEREACNIFFVWEMLRPLCKGVPLYIIPDDVIYDPLKLIKYICDQKITRMLFTPSLMQTIVDCKGFDHSNLRSSFQRMRQIWFCGEVVTTLLRDKVAALFPWIQLLNLYSISECHDVSCADISKPTEKEGKICSVGKLLPGVHAIVLDENRMVKKLNEPGEICVGGPTLAIGYLNKPELTAARFIPTPPAIVEKLGSRLYRTGDWGCVLPDGTFEIYGRCDSMVKIRGYSIEMQAVEAAIRDIQAVSSCCVLAEGAEGSDKILVAYVVLKDGTNDKSQLSSPSTADPVINTKAVTKDLRNILKTKLPFYMIPSIFIFLESIPIHEVSGKLDTQALPKKDLENHTEMIDDESWSTTERRIATIWCKVLRQFAVDTEESFFNLGGHSLLAAQFIGLLNETFNLQWPVSDLYVYPTIKSIARRLDKSEAKEICVDLKKEVESYEIPVENLNSKLRVFRKSNALTKSKYESCKVFVTGATGFLGAFLIDQLLKSSQTYIYCLIRETPHKTPLQRLEETFKSYNLEPGNENSPFYTRVITVKGDITLDNFGLGEDEYTALTFDMDAVIHAAATVNLSFPYHALHRPNVVGTRNVIFFCAQNKIKPLHYISTNDVFPSNLLNCEERCDMTQFSDSLLYGYAQSKWVAEQSVIATNKHGMPSVIYRCGNIGGPRHVPAWNKSDLTLLILQGVLITGYAPDIQSTIDLTPVDFVSKFIVSSLIHFNKSNGQIYHLVNNHSYSFGNLWTLLNKSGYSVKIISFVDWSLKIRNQSMVCSTLRPLSSLLDSTFKDGISFVDQRLFSKTNTTSFLEEIHLEYPEINDELLSTYLDNLEKISFLPPKKTDFISTVSAKELVLQNKVIIVTGASSGIGAAIGEHFAHAGAKVIMTARRLDRLNAVKERMKTKGITVHTMAMDVCNEKEVAESVERIENTIGPIDVLVNNAGVMYYCFMNKGNLSQWLHTMQVNCEGVLNCLAAVLPRMTQRKSGHIINITSDAGRRPFPGLAVYSASKFFVEALSAAMRSEICNEGVKVTCIQPGDVHTELRRSTTDIQAKDMFDFSDKIDLLHATDIAEACMFALTRPPYVAVNEILIEPRAAPL